MLVDNINNLFSRLQRNDAAQISIGGVDIHARVLASSSKLVLQTPVYFGGNFIPKSVRDCVAEKNRYIDSFLPTSLVIDEEQYQISLHYLGSWEHLSAKMLKDLLEEFSLLAEKWKIRLDERDRNDLIEIKIRR